MADLLRITQIVNPKNYTMPTKPLEQSDTVFNLTDMSKVLKPNDRSEQFRQTDDLPSESQTNYLINDLNISKNPAFSGAVLKGLLSNELLSQIMSNGSPEMINEFNEFARNIFITGEDIVADLSTQQQGLTSFNGELFSLLRDIISNSPTPQIKNAVAQLLKSVFTVQSQPEILKSLSANFHYFSQALYPSRSLSQSLESLSLEFAKPDADVNFTALKDKALSLLSSVSNSLVATDEIKNLVSLVRYNISRFSDNPKNLDSAFKALTNLLNDDTIKEKLGSAYSKFLQEDSIPETIKRALNFTNDEVSDAEKTSFRLSDVIKLSSQSISQPRLDESLNTVVQQLAKLIDSSGKNPVISVGDATAQIGFIMGLVLPESADTDIKKLLNSFERTKDLNSLVSRLNHIINSIDSLPMKLSLSKVLNEILSALSNNDDVTYHQPSSMDHLSEFLSKALDNENIEHLGIVNPRELVDTMLTNPGVFTPLLHYVIPLKIDDARSFADVWIDNETMENGSVTHSNHIFLSFDIESVGVFELEMYEADKKLSVNLFCPHGLEKQFSSLKPSFSKIADNAGYTVSKSNVKALKKLRNLVEVFPRIKERRTGLNAKV